MPPSRYVCGRTTGFTLLEVLVSLLVGTVIMGAVMGLLTVSLQYRKRVQDKRIAWPYLEAAAQMILSDPEKYAGEDIEVGGRKDTVEVRAQWDKIEWNGIESAAADAPSLNRILYRVTLRYLKNDLELIVMSTPENSP